MNEANRTKAITAVDAMVRKGDEISGRAKFAHEMLMVNAFGDLEFPLEMIRESIRSLEFWMTELEQALVK